jgi:SPP1 gp7 family putative phage head morphogenesis protein
MKKKLRKYFNQRKRHAEMVARTETAKIQDIANTRRLEEQGVDKVQWITAEDERVRDSHAERHMQVFDIRSSPSLGEPNCRCVKTPYIE